MKNDTSIEKSTSLGASSEKVDSTNKNALKGATGWLAFRVATGIQPEDDSAPEEAHMSPPMPVRDFLF